MGKSGSDEEISLSHHIRVFGFSAMLVFFMALGALSLLRLFDEEFDPWLPSLVIAALGGVVAALVDRSKKRPPEPKWQPIPRAEYRRWEPQSLTAMLGGLPSFVCPRCRSTNTTRIDAEFKPSMLLPTKTTLTYRCNYCGQTYTHSNRSGGGSRRW